MRNNHSTWSMRGGWEGVKPHETPLPLNTFDCKITTSRAVRSVFPSTDFRLVFYADSHNQSFVVKVFHGCVLRKVLCKKKNLKKIKRKMITFYAVYAA